MIPGVLIGTIVLQGFGNMNNENQQPQNRGLVKAGGYYLTYSGGILSARRSPNGETVAGTNWAAEVRGTLRGDARFGSLCASIDPNVATPRRPPGASRRSHEPSAAAGSGRSGVARGSSYAGG